MREQVLTMLNDDICFCTLELWRNTFQRAALFAVLYRLIYARRENSGEIYGRRALSEWQYVDTGRSWPLFAEPSMSRATP